MKTTKQAKQIKKEKILDLKSWIKQNSERIKSCAAVISNEAKDNNFGCIKAFAKEVVQLSEESKKMQKKLLKLQGEINENK